jgi:cysteinyl-tRNA synthetase
LVDFSDNSLRNSQHSLEKIDNFIFRLENNVGNLSNKELRLELVCLMRKFEEAMDDDFNVSAALSHLYGFFNRVNKTIDSCAYNNDDRDEIISYFKKIDKLFKAFDFLEIEKKTVNFSKIEDLIKARKTAKAEKDWCRADEIRNQLISLGVELFDQKDGEITYRIKQ